MDLDSSDSTESDSAGSSNGAPEKVDVELEAETFFKTQWVLHLWEYVSQNPHSTNTLLFSYLAMLKAYVPESHLLMEECQRVLGPPDPIHGGPPFEKRMEPFTDFLEVALPDQVCMRYPLVAKKAVELLATDSRINRNTTVKKFLRLEEPRPLRMQFIKNLLVKRELGENGQEKFSKLIGNILEHEGFHHAVSVLETASSIFRENPSFPQTLARLYYIERGIDGYKKAEQWALKAIRRAPLSSYVADTLGHIYKNLLRRTCQKEEIIKWAQKSFEAFKNVEEKAEREEDPAMVDSDGVVSVSNFFNNRGLFGFVQVAKIVYEKHIASDFPNLLMEVEAKFEFFEWYLTYSAPSMTSQEPPYFWKDVALCYEKFTNKTSTRSTSFPGILELLNHGLFTSRGRRAKFDQVPMTESTFRTIRDDLRADQEADSENVALAARYILSNILMSNLSPPSPQPELLRELQTTMHRFLATDVRKPGPEFHLLVLMLFWPEEQQLQHEVEEQNEEDDKELEGNNDKDGEVVEDWTERDGGDVEGQTEEDESDEADHPVDPATIPPKPLLTPDLQQHVTFMEEVFGASKYGKYLRGRYLLPLFFLGKGSGLSKWIHKSRLDAIVEGEVNVLLGSKQDGDKTDRKKQKEIDEMWVTGKVWQVPRIRDILSPVRAVTHQQMVGEPANTEDEVTVCVGSREIRARVEAETGPSALGSQLFYLGFTIQGPVVFRMGFISDGNDRSA